MVRLISKGPQIKQKVTETNKDDHSLDQFWLPVIQKQRKDIVLNLELWQNYFNFTSSN